MRIVALISGGKDSIYNALLAKTEGHEIVALANLKPKNKDELDSYMYQTVGHQGIEKIAEAMDLPLYRKETKGHSLQKGKSYEPTENDEVEDLYDLLCEVKQKENIKGVACGAILSDYQRVRVENVCQRLELISLTYLWRRDQTELLQEMIDCKIDAIIIKIAALGLLPNHLGKSISDLKPHLCRMHDKYNLNVCGEGGEYETFTLDCPLFKKRIVIEDMQIVLSSSDPICPVGYINFTKLKLEEKNSPSKYVVKTSKDFVKDIVKNEENEDFDEICKDYSPENMLSPESALGNNSIRTSPLNLIFFQNKPQAILNRKGWLFLTGIQSNNENTSIAINECFDKMEYLLNSFAYQLTDLVNVVLYINDMNNFDIINSVYIKRINFQNPPTRICVECEMPKNCVLIMEANACKTNVKNPDIFKKTVLHVQGISHWAPCNIGPYSQSIKIENITYISGQIALIPGNMEIIKGGIHVQTNLALRHINRIIKVMNVNGNLRDILQGICYVTKRSHIEIARKIWEAKSTNTIVDYVVVKKLPRQALVEVQVWAHLGNDKFEYEETGCSIDIFTVLLKRRWNFESECSAGICTISLNSNNEFNLIRDMTCNQLTQAIEYFIKKMYPDLNNISNNDEHVKKNPACLPIRIFYNVYNSPICLTTVLDDLKVKRNDIQLAFHTVPVLGFQSKLDFISINAVRHE